MEKLYRVTNADILNVESYSNLLLLRSHDREKDNSHLLVIKERVDDVLDFASINRNKVLGKDFQDFKRWSREYSDHRHNVNETGYNEYAQ